MVQVLKDELRQAILRNAQDEFMEYGYAAASIKRIADKVGMSAGNLYRYYAGKEALFDAVVNPVFHELELVIRSNVKEPSNEGNIFELVVHALTDIIGSIRKPLLILIDSSKGTKHEDAVLKLHKMMVDNVASHLEAYNSAQGRKVFTEQAAWPISVAFMQGYFEIVRRHPNTDDCNSMVRQYVLFWYQGLRAFL
ncbi:TetR/AcrR family transcriptional regulator [Paenibacillus glacialis]|uniref:TetR family transcriptional regulator n=1 Tax=Paenibacillus glacialis TaxID=494026 RepID=A0A168KR33_9BACL|nr:TetR/AcrR family transcriptional regulator [Paenibacillus glacialis]OAB42354.1 TetR family transcriptional regulator [Paenibacillus glacialis]